MPKIPRARNPVLPEEAVKKLLYICMVCEKQIEDGFYGRWGSGGTCSRDCERKQEALPHSPPPSAEFLQQLEQHDDLNDGFDTQV